MTTYTTTHETACETTNGTIYGTTGGRGKPDGRLAALLEAVAAEAEPLLAEGRTGHIVINFSGGDRVRIETARFRDVLMRTRGTR